MQQIVRAHLTALGIGALAFFSVGDVLASPDDGGALIKAPASGLVRLAAQKQDSAKPIREDKPEKPFKAERDEKPIKVEKASRPEPSLKDEKAAGGKSFRSEERTSAKSLDIKSLEKLDLKKADTTRAAREQIKPDLKSGTKTLTGLTIEKKLPPIEMKISPAAAEAAAQKAKDDAAAKRAADIAAALAQLQQAQQSGDQAAAAAAVQTLVALGAGGAPTASVGAMAIGAAAAQGGVGLPDASFFAGVAAAAQKQKDDAAKAQRATEIADAFATLKKAQDSGDPAQAAAAAKALADLFAGGGLPDAAVGVMATEAAAAQKAKDDAAQKPCSGPLCAQQQAEKLLGGAF